MKNLITVTVLLLASFSLFAQNPDIIVEPSADSAATILPPSVNAEWDGADIFGLLAVRKFGEGTVTVEQSGPLAYAFGEYVSANAHRRIHGYRVRIYSGNSQNARAVSSEIAAGFAASYPEIPVYKTYTNPFFKVTVGDFRTRDEAVRFANSISGRYPSAFLVKENINYPSLW